MTADRDRELLAAEYRRGNHKWEADHLLAGEVWATDVKVALDAIAFARSEGRREALREALAIAEKWPSYEIIRDELRALSSNREGESAG